MRYKEVNSATSNQTWAVSGNHSNRLLNETTKIKKNLF